MIRLALALALAAALLVVLRRRPLPPEHDGITYAGGAW